MDPRADLSALHGPDGSGVKFLVGQYVSLMKPRIIELLLITTIPVMFLAEQGVPDLWLVVATVVGGTLSAGAANTLNCYIDRDIDAVMHRTSRRPLVTGTISPRGALLFGVALTVLSTLWLGLLVNWLSAWLALAALLFYVFGYTLVLKRRTAQNIVWGGAAGCMPVLIGWSAVTDSLSWSAFILFMVIFFWTPPHYWPLSMRYKDDYSAAHVPMLPVVERFVVVAKQVVAYSWAMVLTSLALIPVQQVGWVYAVAAVVSGVLFLAEAHRLLS
ncbi:MAG: protoheme IX farnesyltransferase, partial [Terrabacter sp.]|nr:protoheme IX farnesyltransferase [Terrabacter sp.]